MGGLLCNDMMAVQTLSSTEVLTEATSTRTITIVRIAHNGGMTITARKQGQYDPDNNTVTIDGCTYNVRENPRYGTNCKEGAYEYMAGGEYYFNL